MSLIRDVLNKLSKKNTIIGDKSSPIPPSGIITQKGAKIGSVTR